MPIVEATGIAARSQTPGLGKAIEKAMSDAYLKAVADGISDPAAQRELMQLARAQAKAAFYAAQNPPAE